MIPVKQTILHDPDNGKHGNCLSAVLASLLHLPIEDIPVFSSPETWRKELNKWLSQYGLAYMSVVDVKPYIRDAGIVGLHHEICGTTMRGKDTLHACVAVDGDMVFDPHPGATGLLSLEEYSVFVALRPWEVANATKRI